MGFRVESYSLNELHRIAVPGAVAPSLFWALPVGDWNHGELEEVWRWFTEHRSDCNDYGLLLVKEMGRREGESANVNLASVGAKLSDLMPAGAERFLHPQDRDRGESPRVLVLSGGYPQPGWGVLVEWQRGNIHRFEDLISRTICQMRGEDAANNLNVFMDAAQAFQLRKNLRAAPAKPNVSVIEGEILAAERIERFLREAQCALQADEHRLVGEKLIAAIQGAGQAAWLNIPEGSLQSLRDAQLTLLTAASVFAVSREIYAKEIEPQLQPLLADPSRRIAVFTNLSSDAVKHALKACLHLRSTGIVDETGSFQDWAERALPEFQRRLTAALSELRQAIEAKLLAPRGVKSHREREYDIAVKEWRLSSNKAQEWFHAAAGKAVELQWELGPQFLVAFEQICRQDGLWVRSIPWDPARMVGWKIMGSQVSLNSGDLQIAAEELAPDATGASATNGISTAVADGSYFTDYVHHIAISKPGFSPRAVTRKLLARLLRPAEMRSLIETHTGGPPTATDAPLLAEELLQAFGWRQSDEVREKPLAGCINGSGDTEPTIAGNLSGNDLRIVVESFCKDIVDVVITQLGYSHAEVWNTIEQRIPGYRQSSRMKDWEEEVRLMTVGAAGMILPALGPLAFPEQADNVKAFAVDLQKLADVLNKTSHHREGEPVSSEAPIEAASLIRQLLGSAVAFLGDLPWHLEASFVYGEQPKVLSGEAWSHGSPTRRLLRVIVWTGTSPGTHVTFWNKERRNPVVPDPVFIVRPRIRQ